MDEKRESDSDDEQPTFSQQAPGQGSTTEILGDFGKGLQTLLEQALAKKSAELAERERIVQEREAKVDHILKNIHMKGRIKLQVGNNTYDTQSDILLSSPDSYFHGLLNKEFLKNKEYDGNCLFIARDGEAFKYVLEHLTYGQIISEIDESMLKKLEMDAKFFILPRLQNEVSLLKKRQMVTPISDQEKLVKAIGESIVKPIEALGKSIDGRLLSLGGSIAKPIEALGQSIDGRLLSLGGSFAKPIEALGQSIDALYSKKEKIFLHVQSTATVSNGSWFNWNSPKEFPNTHFKQPNTSTITILKAGLYQIIVRYVSTCSTHGNGAANIDLYVAGNVVARYYHGQPNNYQTSGGLTEIIPLQANDTIMVKYLSNNNGVADQLANTLTLLLL